VTINAPEPAFFLGFVMMSVVESAPMRLSPTILAVLAALAIVGCANKQDQITPAEAQTEKKDQREYNQEVDSRIQ
jgi:mannose/fructose/N-acetylgalactosamine-specific phosphotransferase system component IIC